MAEDKLLRLQAETGCDPVLGALLLQFTGDDIEGALKILQSVEKNIIVLRLKFIGQSTKITDRPLFFIIQRSGI